MTLQEAKDQIAKKYGKESWYLWGYEYSEPYGKTIPEKYMDEAAELYCRINLASFAPCSSIPR